MNKKLALVLLTLSTVPLAACADGYGYGGVSNYGAGPYSYDGYYDGYYGDVYDGYWGSDNNFYYRHGAGDHAYIRGDRGHFSRDMPHDGGNRGGGNGGRSFQPLHGTMTPGQGMRMPHFPGGGGHGGGGHGGGGEHH